MAKQSKIGRNKVDCQKYRGSKIAEKHRDTRMLRKLKELEKLHPENSYEIQEIGKDGKLNLTIVRTKGKKPFSKKQIAKRAKKQFIVTK